jgi:hypothetical protein
LVALDVAEGPIVDELHYLRQGQVANKERALTDPFLPSAVPVGASPCRTISGPGIIHPLHRLVGAVLAILLCS